MQIGTRYTPNQYSVNLFVILSLLCSTVSAQTLEQQLQNQEIAELASACASRGDARRGAILFFQPNLACHQCHRIDATEQESLGPSLATLDKRTSDAELIESVLYPSKTIRKNYRSVAVLMADGSTVNGFLELENDQQILLRDLIEGGKRISLDRAEVEDIKPHRQSLMPAGQVNQLASEQQFYDLMKYLFEIRSGGMERALALQPAPQQLSVGLPEYEQHIDHAGFIRRWNADSLERGQAIYRRVCQSCHGTVTELGSLPTSLRFSQGRFKNGSDPYSMYRTLTHGFGLMTPQAWMVPSQKYDVIHYIREVYLQPHNPSQVTSIDENYLNALPEGDTFGPEPSSIEPWSLMNYGPYLTHTYEIPGEKLNIAYKGIAVQLDQMPGGISHGKYWMVFDTDTLRMASGWSASSSTGSHSNFIDWRGIQFNGEHAIHPRAVGEVAFANGNGPGWANPDGRFEDDQRVVGRDGLRYGPLPKSWGRFHGTYSYKNRVIFSYAIQDIEILESPSLRRSADRVAFERTLHVAPHREPLQLRLGDALEMQRVRIQPADADVKLVAKDEALIALVAPHDRPESFSVWIEDVNSSHLEAVPVVADEKPADLTQWIHGGPSRWESELLTQPQVGNSLGAFAVDTLTSPDTNPWQAQMRFTGLDFLSDGSMAACTWDGDVWLIRENGPTLRWKRMASGLFQPLGLKVVRDKIYLTCRDQLACLHDLNHDEEIDFIECVNNDHQVTAHFHEFAMGLQTDEAGNFYYAKSACHALPAVVPHHGTLLKISPDGSNTQILANGFRAANGVCLNPDGSFFVTDQEGHWNPKNRINWVSVDDKGPKFYGNMYSYTDQTDASDSAMVQPLCWITNAFDRSPAELLWVNSQNWGPLHGALLNLSYGYGKVFVVLHERAGDQMQGGMVELPIPAFPTGIIRGRFKPQDGHLYVAGMYSWAGSRTHPGGLYRIRATGKPMRTPIQLHANQKGVAIHFSEPLEVMDLSKAEFKVKIWSLKRTAEYGSQHYDERTLKVIASLLSDDRTSVQLDIEGIQPTWCMEIVYRIPTKSGEVLEGKIHNTIHRLF